MPFNLGNALPLFINIIIRECQIGSLFTLGLDFTMVKIEEVCHTKWNLDLKIFSLTPKNAIVELTLLQQ